MVIFLAPILAIGVCVHGVVLDQIVYQRVNDVDVDSWKKANPRAVPKIK